MPQNLIQMTLTTDDLTAIDAAITTLETKLAGLIDLTPGQRRELTKMGDKSENFVRQTFVVARQNVAALPANFLLPEAENDIATLDKLRPRLANLTSLTERLNDTVVALGSDAMVAALEAYGLLKISGRGEGLDQLRQEMSARFARGSRSTTVTTSPASGSGH
jgi:hypothetical protein